MSILFDSPIPYESISEGRRKEQALGGQLAKSMMDSYFRATSLRAQQEQWAEEAPLREANQTMMAARAEGEKIDSQLKSLKLINETRKKESIAGLAAIQEEAAMSGWNWMSRAGYHEYISKHPELFGSPEAESVERNFDNAEMARAREREWKAKEANDLLIARERAKANADTNQIAPGTIINDSITGQRRIWTGSSYQVVQNLTPDQQAFLESELALAKDLPRGRQETRIKELMDKWGVQLPASSSIGRPTVTPPETIKSDSSEWKSFGNGMKFRVKQ